MKKEAVVVIPNRLGLHARPASRFASLANEFVSEIRLVKGDSEVDGKSILEILSLASPKGSTLVIRTEGPDAEEALINLKALVESGFGSIDL